MFHADAMHYYRQETHLVVVAMVQRLHAMVARKPVLHLERCVVRNTDACLATGIAHWCIEQLRRVVDWSHRYPGPG